MIPTLGRDGVDFAEYIGYINYIENILSNYPK